MSPDVKICGIKTLEALEAAISAGASHFGMVFFPPSPRHLSLAEAKRLADAARGRIAAVALVVDADDAAIEAIAAAAAPDMIQLHGGESPERAARIRALAGCPVIKAISVAGEGDADRAADYRGAADLILFDAKPPRNHTRPGGNGLAFDWRLIAPLRARMRFMLSGGLTPENVAEAVARTGAAMVDVSSGVERAPGDKDPALIHRFVRAAHTPAYEETAHG